MRCGVLCPCLIGPPSCSLVWRQLMVVRRGLWACAPSAHTLAPRAACRRAWEGLKPTEVLRRVASNVRLQFPPQTPHRLKVRRHGGDGKCWGTLGLHSTATEPGWAEHQRTVTHPAPARLPTELQVLGERCMEYSPTARPTMDEVLSGAAMYAPRFFVAQCMHLPLRCVCKQAASQQTLQAAQSHVSTPARCAEVNSILSDTMGILQQFLAASSAASAGRYAGGSGALPSSASELQPSDPFR